MLDRGLKTDFIIEIIEIIPNVLNFRSVHLCIVKIYLCVQLLLIEGRQQAPTLLGRKSAPELGLGVSWFHGSCKRYVSNYMKNITVLNVKFENPYETVPCRFAVIRTKISSCKHLHTTKTTTIMDRIPFFKNIKYQRIIIFYLIHCTHHNHIDRSTTWNRNGSVTLGTVMLRIFSINYRVHSARNRKVGSVPRRAALAAPRRTVPFRTATGLLRFEPSGRGTVRYRTAPGQLDTAP